MPKWTLFGLLTAPVVIVLVAFAAAHLFAPDDPTRQIAIIAVVFAGGGFAVNYGKNAYDVWDKERERRKKSEENKERLRIIPTYRRYDSGKSVVGVQIYNEGKVPVAIRAVTLCIDTAEIKNVFPLFMISGRSKDGMEEYAVTKKLEPHEHVDFFVPFGEGPSTKELVMFAPNSLWIRIELFSGGSEQVSGEEIRRAIYRDSEFNWSDDSAPALT
jgi:hypothetical protein